MSGLADGVEELILDRIFRGGTDITPAATYVAALKTLPSEDAGTSIAELTMTGYARQQVLQNGTAWTDPSAGNQGETDNLAEIDFGTLTGSTERVVGVAVYSAVTAGTLYFWSALATGWQPFSADEATETITCFGHGYSDNDRVFVRGSSLPAGYAENVEYFVVSSTTDTLGLSLTQGGAAVAITTDAGGEIGASNAQDIASGNQLKIAAGALNIRLN